MSPILSDEERKQLEQICLEEDLDAEFDTIWGTEEGNCTAEEFHRRMQATIELAKRGTSDD